MRGFAMYHYRSLRGRDLVFCVSGGSWSVRLLHRDYEWFALRGPNHWRDVRRMLRSWERGLCGA